MNSARSSSSKQQPSTDAERRLWEARRMIEVLAKKGERLGELAEAFTTDDSHKEAAENLGIDLAAITTAAQSASECFKNFRNTNNVANAATPPAPPVSKKAGGAPSKKEWE